MTFGAPTGAAEGEEEAALALPPPEPAPKLNGAEGNELPALVLAWSSTKFTPIAGAHTAAAMAAFADALLAGAAGPAGSPGTPAASPQLALAERGERPLPARAALGVHELGAAAGLDEGAHALAVAGGAGEVEGRPATV